MTLLIDRRSIFICYTYDLSSIPGEVLEEREGKIMERKMAPTLPSPTNTNHADGERTP